MNRPEGAGFAQDARAEPQPYWFLALFAFAAAGGAIAYVPFLTVLLPLKVAETAGEGDVAALSLITFAGAGMASLANIAFGVLSDRSGSRLGWVAIGLACSCGLLVAIGRAGDMTAILLLVLFWQVGLNMMLGPLIAWAGDCFPDSQKGLLGGSLALAPALGALAGSLVTFEGLVASEWRYEFVAAITAALVLPALVFGRGRARPGLMRGDSGNGTGREAVRGGRRRIVARLWLARFLVQVAEAGLFAFLLLWLRSLAPGLHENVAANVFSLVLVVSVPVTLWIGRWSDRRGRPIRPLWISAAGASAGLSAMALSGSVALAIAGYLVFGLAASVFLALHTGQTLRFLPQPRHRGRDLGFFNLTNTAPSMVMPWLTLALVPGFGFAGLFALFAVLTGLAALVLATHRPAN